MAFVLTEEEEAVRRTARALARERAPVVLHRRLRDERDPVGFSAELWRELASLGLAGLPVGPAHGGSGLGLAPLGLVLEELGRTLAATPLLSTTVLAAGAIEALGTDQQKAEHLPDLCSGARVMALAHDEGVRHRREPSQTRLEARGEALVLEGEKTMVIDGHVAEAFVVSARGPGREGTTLVLVPAGAEGVSVTRLSLVDGRNAAKVSFGGVKLSPGALLGDGQRAGQALGRLLDRGAAALSAEMLGSALEVFERTVAYLKERKQFGVPIGSFQALKHRAAWMFCELELSKSIVREALCACDDGRAEASLLCSTAKARLSETFLLVANEAVQMHGGVGVTDELDVGFFLKRARVAEALLGDAAFHRQRFAELSGY